MKTASKTSSPTDAVRTWLYILAVVIVIMILVGGATRLTDSGLSITEWAPIRGILPPLSADQWLAEFAAYQTTDEFKFQNSAMTLEQFKTIYWWEWGHRFLGRVIGLAILLPLIWFWFSGRLDGRLKVALVYIFLLVCLQGALGWWMVKSGLTNRVDVSQLRLAIHLLAACVLLVTVVWVARSLAPHTQGEASAGYWQAGLLVVLVLVQVFSGGLVAGLDAGMAYNTWPKMNDAWIPDGLWTARPIWINLTDNALTVQFFHRTLACVLWVFTVVHAISMRRSEPGTTHSRRALLLVVLTTLQAMIGIVTLLLKVPVFWALLHQFGGMVVLVFATAHWRALRPYQDTKASQDYGTAGPADVPV